ncbi:uncharacterized protein DEA37_0012257 [Paragonimus westermani]|uniref:Transcription initiation factor TFIID subunit 9B n=1 Tax=Paragonimus westermani TaxID=34504 RepID=A0A5J4P1D5_9TREM|nr:uncharacterized protein DEA37_0012257 [Paragonimus westermani]
MVEAKGTNEVSELLPPSLGAVRDVFEEFNVPDVSDEICTRILDVLYSKLSLFNVSRDNPAFPLEHTCDIVDEAKAIANHAGHQNIEEGDMKLAIESLSDCLMFSPPHKKQLLMYSEKNGQPLPAIRAHHGIRLPHERNNLTAPNYTLAKPESDLDQQQRIGRDAPIAGDATISVVPTVPVSNPQGSLLRLSAATGVTRGTPPTVRVIAPPGIGPSMIRIQSVQHVPQLPVSDAAPPMRAISTGSVGTNLTNVQLRFADVS